MSLKGIESTSIGEPTDYYQIPGNNRRALECFRRPVWDIKNRVTCLNACRPVTPGWWSWTETLPL